MVKAVFGEHRRRSILGFMLMVSQAFLYNAIFFTYALVLTNFYAISSDAVGWYLLPFAAGNFLGPVLLGRLFDTVGRRVMITITYVMSGLGLVVVGYLFQQDAITATQLTIGWSVIFFFASAGASSAYLTVSEMFPMEMRAMAIAFFYAVATGVGGIIGPALYGHNIATGNRTTVFYGYLLGAALMILGGLSEVWLGVNAEQRQLEDIAEPLTAGSLKRIREQLAAAGRWDVVLGLALGPGNEEACNGRLRAGRGPDAGPKGYLPGRVGRGPDPPWARRNRPLR